MNQLKETIVGSYDKNDCEFLLDVIEPTYYEIEDKEKLIQSGELHYSDMISRESRPTAQYSELFFTFTDKYKRKLAEHILTLAKIIDKNRSGEIVLVSLARAGTPIGVLLKKALELTLNREARHYSISIVRDRGIDTNALDYLIKNQSIASHSIVFIDGWTAKGVINRELKLSIDRYNLKNNTAVPRDLYVISDCGGCADFCATDEDYPIPSSMLNSTVSGLISRSVWQSKQSGRFHGCVINNHLADDDHSNWFIDQVVREFNRESEHENTLLESQNVRQEKMQCFVEKMKKAHSISDINYMKPGIAESTRVMLRRVPSLLILRSLDSSKVQHLILLAKEKNVTIFEDETLLFEACTIIKTMNKGAE
ncbi:cysteine protease StiP family protein [Vibrio ostreicida]|uniref:Cysteine protease StiP family protein n=1 Tax=Vibrio ostreicida TaxID=526588 RepID=A0ABT8BUM0_9VIBR|nr:cysteine protease StiP family protein [Vibrio ostreicida]MDN3610845.1 cysteine protease StiP family protein [Vibrio ostreicida]NPD07166.1 cysteine protease StiP family protein [Vibrio ostreicida]